MQSADRLSSAFPAFLRSFGERGQNEKPPTKTHLQL
jgi:hypothetical protein